MLVRTYHMQKWLWKHNGRTPTPAASPSPGVFHTPKASTGHTVEQAVDGDPPAQNSVESTIIEGGFSAAPVTAPDGDNNGGTPRRDTTARNGGGGGGGGWDDVGGGELRNTAERVWAIGDDVCGWSDQVLVSVGGVVLHAQVR